MTGLKWFSLESDNAELLAAQEQRLRNAGAAVNPRERIETVDPWGTRVRLLRV